MIPPPANLTRPQTWRLLIEATGKLAGYQVIGLGRAWNLCTGLDCEDLEPEEAGHMRWLLEELGYERQWVSERGVEPMQHMWVRDAWPIDKPANQGRDMAVYLPM